jgi:hypothetical protein
MINLSIKPIPWRCCIYFWSVGARSLRSTKISWAGFQIVLSGQPEKKNRGRTFCLLLVCFQQSSSSMNISANRLSTFLGPQTTWPYLDDDRYSAPEEVSTLLAATARSGRSCSTPTWTDLVISFCSIAGSIVCQSRALQCIDETEDWQGPMLHVWYNACWLETWRLAFGATYTDIDKVPPGSSRLSWWPDFQPCFRWRQWPYAQGTTIDFYETPVPATFSYHGQQATATPNHPLLVKAKAITFRWKGKLIWK